MTEIKQQLSKKNEDLEIILQKDDDNDLFSEKLLKEKEAQIRELILQRDSRDETKGLRRMIAHLEEENVQTKLMLVAKENEIAKLKDKFYKTLVSSKNNIEVDESMRQEFNKLLLDLKEK